MALGRCFVSLAILLIGAAPGRADPAGEVTAIYPDVEKLYIDLHKNPELAFHEKRTAATLAARLKALGYVVTTGVGGTGVVAITRARGFDLLVRAFNRSTRPR